MPKFVLHVMYCKPFSCYLPVKTGGQFRKLCIHISLLENLSSIKGLLHAFHTHKAIYKSTSRYLKDRPSSAGLLNT